MDGRVNGRADIRPALFGRYWEYQSNGIGVGLLQIEQRNKLSNKNGFIHCLKTIHYMRNRHWQTNRPADWKRAMSFISRYSSALIHITWHLLTKLFTDSTNCSVGNSMSDDAGKTPADVPDTSPCRSNTTSHGPVTAYYQRHHIIHSRLNGQ